MNRFSVTKTVDYGDRRVEYEWRMENFSKAFDRFNKEVNFCKDVHNGTEWYVYLYDEYATSLRLSVTGADFTD